MNTKLLALLFAWLGLVSGNTEIVNFSSGSSPAIDLEMQFPNLTWYNLDLASGMRQLELLMAPYGQPWSDVCNQINCEYEIFVRLELEDIKDLIWGEQTEYSLRISWPASIPADFDVKVYNPTQLQHLFRSREPDSQTTWASLSHTETRDMFARIRARYSGVRAPSHYMWYLFSPLVPLPSDQPTVDFHLVLDYLFFGFIPQSVVPTIWLVLAAIVIGSVVSRSVTAHMEAIASGLENAKEE